MKYFINTYLTIILIFNLIAFIYKALPSSNYGYGDLFVHSLVFLLVLCYEKNDWSL
mgnify:CR=1 FL=1